MEKIFLRWIIVNHQVLVLLIPPSWWHYYHYVCKMVPCLHQTQSFQRIISVPWLPQQNHTEEWGHWNFDKGRTPNFNQWRKAAKNVYPPKKKIHIFFLVDIDPLLIIIYFVEFEFKQKQNCQKVRFWGTNFSSKSSSNCYPNPKPNPI